MTWLLLAGVWVCGGVFVWLLVAGGTRPRYVELFRPLEDIDELARCA